VGKIKKQGKRVGESNRQGKPVGESNKQGKPVVVIAKQGEHAEKSVMNTVAGIVGDSARVVTNTEEEPFNNIIMGLGWGPNPCAYKWGDQEGHLKIGISDRHLRQAS
jgi:hypothetical protein